MPTIIFDKFLPDASPKAPGLIQVENLVPRDGKYMPLPSAVELTDAAVGTPLVLFQIRDNEGDKTNILGASTKVYRYTSGSTLTDITNAGGNYSISGDTWDWDTYQDKLYMCVLDENTQTISDMISGANLADLSNAPKAKTMRWYRNQLFFGYTDESGTKYPRRLRRSIKGDATDYTTTASGAGYKDIDAWGQEIRAIRTIDSVLLVYMDNSIWVVDELGPPLWFSYNQIFEGDGPIALHSVVELDSGNHMFIGKNDIYMVSGRNVIPLNAPVNRTVVNNIDPDNGYLITSFVDKSKKVVYWIYPESGSDSPSRMLMYNYAEQRFSEGDVTAYGIGSVASPGYTIDGLDNLSSTIDGLPNEPIDSAFFNGGAFTRGIITSDKKLGTLTGDPLDQTVKTGDIFFEEEALGTVTGLRPIIEQPDGTVTGTIHTRFSDSDATSSADSGTMQTNGSVDIRATGRYMQFELNISGDHSGLRGVGYDVKPAGRRR